MQTKAKKCKFCGNEADLIKAHIIPAGFFRRIRKGKKALEIITNTMGEYKKRSQVGVYDKNIVCRRCEMIWQEWDDYAQKILVEELPEERNIYREHKKYSYGYIDNYNYDKLKLFFISLIWRASVSGEKHYQRISLGKFENIAKQMVENANPGDSEDFNVVLSRFNDPFADGILDPYMYENCCVHYCRLYLGRYMADIKIDDKPAPDIYSKCSIRKNRPLYIVYRDFGKSKEFNLIKELLGIPPH